LEKKKIYLEQQKWDIGYDIYGSTIKSLTKAIKKYSQLTGVSPEIAKYEFLKSRTVILRLIRLSYKHKLAEQTFVDVGCGNLFLLEFLRKQSNAYLIGLDITDRVFKNKKNIISRDRINAIVASATNLPFQDNIISSFVSSEVIEHIQDIGNFFHEIYRCLNIKGKLILTTPNAKIRYWNLFNIFHMHKRRTRNIENNSEKHRQPFEKFNDSIQIVRILKDLSFKNTNIQYFFFHPGQKWFTFKSKLLNLTLYHLFLTINPIAKRFFYKFGRIMLIQSTKA